VAMGEGRGQHQSYGSAYANMIDCAVACMRRWIDDPGCQARRGGTLGKGDKARLRGIDSVGFSIVF